MMSIHYGSTIFIFVLVLLASACTHSPIHTEHSDTSNSKDLESTKTTLASLNKEPDFINPLLSDDLSDKYLNSNSNNDLIWDRIGKKLELTRFYDHPQVILQKHKFLNNEHYLSVVSKRSEPFIHFVLTEIEKRQMPPELALLPIVESGYYPRARSRAKAEGLWQIMSYTGKELGLKRSYSYDGRHDVYAATSAALDYLAQMYNRFDGDWLLALAAYNAGPQRVKRAMKYAKHAHNENIYWKLRLPRETREYVPKILALGSIVKDRGRSKTLLHPIFDEPYLDTIQLTKRISPAKLIKTSGVSESEIKLLNPALRNLNTPIHAGYHMLVPKDDVEQVSVAINSMDEEKQPIFAQHRINRGESLSGIARRYGTSVTAIREANNLHGNKIVAGRSLLVPTGTTRNIQQTAQAKSNSQEIASLTRPSITEPQIYVVAFGDSFWKIASRNNTTVQRLFEINGRDPDQPLQAGETILVD